MLPYLSDMDIAVAILWTNRADRRKLGPSMETAMQTSAQRADPARALMLQFLGWIAERPRTRSEVMEAWRSTCPRLTIWEDAIIEGLVRIDPRSQTLVMLTEPGRALLELSRPADHSAPCAG